ncbi:hypothetical protein TNCV_2476101 [Trichonephila clavipes]|nr:hypothetical protein TNCV_2476101 [Trichonephila clavipes]
MKSPVLELSPSTCSVDQSYWQRRFLYHENVKTLIENDSRWEIIDKPIQGKVARWAKCVPKSKFQVTEPVSRSWNNISRRQVTSPICVLCDTGQDMTAAHLDECSALNDLNCIDVCHHSIDCCLDSGVMWNTHVSSPVTIQLNMASPSSS